MMFTKEQINLLNADLDASKVSQREKGNITLSFIEGWHAIAEANRIFGHGNWWRKTMSMRQLHKPYKNERNNWVVSYMAKSSIMVTTQNDREDSVLREGYGYGSGFARDIGEAHESAIKEAETDAMKRALMTFGWPFGLALYDKQQEHVSNNGAPKAEPKQHGNLHGPLNITSLKAEMRTFAKKLSDAGTAQQLEDLLDEYQPVLDQCQRDLPAWWEGTEDHDGANQRIAVKREALWRGEQAEGITP